MNSNELDAMIVLTTGKQDRGARATLAFAWACTALAMGKSVNVYLTMDGTIWSLEGAPDGVQVDGFEPLGEYIDQFLSLDGKLIVCAPCSEYYCGFDRARMRDRLRPDAEIVGLTTVVGRIETQTNVVSF